MAWSNSALELLKNVIPVQENHNASTDPATFGKCWFFQVHKSKLKV